jgi:hypothetical protein
VILFGDGLKGKENARMKGQLTGSKGILLRLLYHRSKQLKAAVVIIDEYNTSKVRNKFKLLRAAN